MTATTSMRVLHGPKPRFLLGNIPQYAPDPLAFLTRCAREYGELVPIKFGPFTTHLATSPALVEEVLATRAKDFRKSIGTRLLTPLVGNGLLTAEGDFWLKQRRLAQPAFHRERIAAYGRTMVDFAEESVAGWEAGREVDLHAELMALTYRIVAKVLFDANVEGRVADVAAANAAIQDYLEGAFDTLRFLIPSWVPTPGNIRYRRWVRRLDKVVYAIIRERKAQLAAAGGTDDRGDLLSILLAARDDDGQPMSERQLRDEVMTLMLAGHETTALALTWALMLLAQNPDADRRLREELASVLGGRAPTTSDVPQLKYTEAVINETMRLYPPAYTTGREAIRETRVGQLRVPKRGVIVVAQWVTHRDPRLFEAAESFRPERWLDGLAKRLPRGAFYPFGLGPRKCIGADFAMLESTLLLATITQRRRFQLTPGQSFEPQPAVTLRPREGVKAVPQIA